MTEMPAQVAEAFAAFTPAVQEKLQYVRNFIFETAKSENVGRIEETLKWGQPAYLTKPKVGSTIRLGSSVKNPGRASVFFICNTNLVSRFKDIYPDRFMYDGNREIYFDEHSHPNQNADALNHCLAMALTYHRNK